MSKYRIILSKLRAEREANKFPSDSYSSIIEILLKKVYFIEKSINDDSWYEISSSDNFDKCIEYLLKLKEEQNEPKVVHEEEF